jgi:transcriptional regulator with PAS, ATPase and Fis domain
MPLSPPRDSPSGHDNPPDTPLGPPAPTTKRGGITLCDPYHERRHALRGGLEKAGLSVVEAADWSTLKMLCDDGVAGVIALPLLWPGAPTSWAGPGPEDLGPELLAFLRAEAGKRDVIIYTDTHRIPMGVYCKALAVGARRILNDQSSTFVTDLAETLARLERDRQARQEEREQLGEVFARMGLIGTSPALLEVFRRALKASHFSDLPVLLLGETGTGKQQIAEAIHSLDPRRADRPFVTVNCGAIHDTLAGSELFGHVKGAFSGADKDRTGLFRAAEGGTLMLDEIGELDPRLQTKLLRVLQERRLLPVGQDYEHAIDIRIIAATNRPLRDMVAAGTFREDLYQRLNVFRIVTPPLRERPQDIEAQALYFLKVWGEQHARAMTFGPRVLEALRLLPWEGNSRQLRNFLWEALTHKDEGSVLGMEDLPPWVLESLSISHDSSPETLSIEDLTKTALENSLTLSEAVEDYERRLLQQVLQRFHGNRTQTAAKLGLTPRSVFNKIKKYGLD